MAFLLDSIRKISLATQIFLALFFGIVLGAVCCTFAAGTSFATGFLRPVGIVFVNLLKMIVVPVVFLSIINGIISMGDLRKLGSVGLKSVSCFFVTSVLSCVTGLVLASGFSAGGLFPRLTVTGKVEIENSNISGFADVMLGLFTSADMLTVIIVAVIVGVAILRCGEKGKPAARILDSFCIICDEITRGIIKLSPVAVFAMMGWVVSTQGLKIMGTLAAALLCAYVGYAVYAIVIYSIFLKFFTEVSPVAFFRSSFPAMVFAFTSASSVATIPVSKECCRKMGANSGVASFVLPLGATINMNGTAIYQCVATVMLASCCGVSLSLEQMLFVVAAVVAASIGTAGVPGSATITLAMVLTSVGIPVDAIMIIYGIDRIFDMGRTVINITGDILCAVCVSCMEEAKSKKFNTRTTS